MSYCLYFQAEVKKDHILLLTSILRSCEYLAFDRTIDVKNNVFEFFVPKDSEKEFLSLMEYFRKNNVISTFQKLPNRLMIEVA